LVGISLNKVKRCCEIPARRSINYRKFAQTTSRKVNVRFSALLAALLILASAAFGADATSVAALAELTKPAKKIPFKDVIRATTQHRVLDFDTNNPAHIALHKKLSVAATAAAAKARADGLFAARANEAGNHMEAFVKAELKKAGLDARTPVTTAGEAQTVGYPDIEIIGDPPCYLELKTYNATTANTTQRSFYYSPSEHPKVTRDALHLLLAYQLEKTGRDGKTAFIPTRWKLITLQDLEVDLKFEFNQSNRKLYGREAGKALIGEGEIK
jgi:hypothetical protein